MHALRTGGHIVVHHDSLYGLLRVGLDSCEGSADAGDLTAELLSLNTLLSLIGRRAEAIAELQALLDSLPQRPAQKGRGQ